jgi:hypothetical protein
MVPLIGMAVVVVWVDLVSNLWTLVPHPEVVRV